MSGPAKPLDRQAQPELHSLACDVAQLVSSAERIKAGLADLQRLAMKDEVQLQTVAEWLQDYDRGPA